MTQHTAVLGGGALGLTLAYRLASGTLFLRSSRLGTTTQAKVVAALPATSAQGAIPTVA